jgi:hypothetical protein
MAATPTTDRNWLSSALRGSPAARLANPVGLHSYAIDSPHIADRIAMDAS